MQRFTRQQLEWLEEPPHAALEIFEENARSIIAKNDSPDVGFSYSLNPYRGCFHACAYCYARPTHQYLDFGAGTDFERKIVVKTNAPQKLIEELEKPSWNGSDIVFSGVTDCYQPIEAHYELTRRCLTVLAKYRNPVGVITKGTLIRRDVDILAELSRNARVQVYLSVAFADDDLSKLIEPHAPRPSARFRAISDLTAAGIPVGVGLAPVIPGLNDSQIPEILSKAKRAGASRAFMTLLRLPAEVKDVFMERISAALSPELARKVFAQTCNMRGGAFNRSEFGQRMRGNGAEWEAVEWLFQRSVEREGLNRPGSTANSRNSFRRPSAQLDLFNSDSR